MRKKKCMFKHKEFMTKIVPPKITIYVIKTQFYNFNICNSMINLHFCFVFETHFIGSLPNS